MKIAIQIINPAYSYEDADTAMHIAEAAIAAGHTVTIFLFADSVESTNKNVKPIRVDRNIPKTLEQMIKEKGLDVQICSLCMEYRGLLEDQIIEGAKPSGLPGLAEMIYNYDRFVSLSA
jgi:tRNA 2-thiouridine synthesizing protein D